MFPTRRLALAVLWFAACGGDDPAAAPDASFPVTPHPPYPVLTNHGGKILDTPQLVTITFAGYAQADKVEQFGDFIVTSDWFHAVGDEYGIHGGVHLRKVRLSDPSPATFGDAEARALITTKIQSGVLPAPGGANAQVIYMIYVPPETQRGVMGVYGYHDAYAYLSTDYAYSLIYDFGTGIQVTTTTAAHELIEASTDPYRNPDTYYLDRPFDDVWYLASGQECADLCDSENLIFAGPWQVQRSWSNQAASMGLPPCVPADARWEGVFSTPSRMPTIGAGQTTSFTLTGWSTVPENDWQVTLTQADNSDLTLADMKPVLSSPNINNGKTVTLKLTAPASGASGKIGGVYVRSGNQLRTWPVGFLVQ